MNETTDPTEATEPETDAVDTEGNLYVPPGERSGTVPQAQGQGSQSAVTDATDA